MLPISEMEQSHADFTFYRPEKFPAPMFVMMDSSVDFCREMGEEMAPDFPDAPLYL